MNTFIVAVAAILALGVFLFYALPALILYLEMRDNRTLNGSTNDYDDQYPDSDD